MFSLEITSLDPRVLRAFSNMFAELSDSVESPTKEEMTATQYIHKLDLPDVGLEVHTTTSPITHVQQAPFSPGVIFGGVSSTNPTLAEVFGKSDAAAIFGGSQVPNVAPSTAVVSPPLTVPVVSGVPLQPNVPFPPAPPQEHVGAIAVPPGISPVLLDKNGMPWDARIHSSSREQTAKAVWKMRRGVDDTLVAQVTAELRASTPAAVSVPRPPLASIAATPPAQPVAPPPPVAITADGDGFVRVCKLKEERAIDATKLLSILNGFGVQGLALLAIPSNWHLIPAVYAALLVA